MRTSIFGVGLALVLLTAAGSSVLAAETSQVVPFTGCDGSLAGPLDLRLRLFASNKSGAPVFEETQLGVDAGIGCISVQIGDATVDGIPAAVFSENSSLWIAFALDATPDIELGAGRTSDPLVGLRSLRADPSWSAGTPRSGRSGGTSG